MTTKKTSVLYITYTDTDDKAVQNEVVQEMTNVVERLNYKYGEYDPSFNWTIDEDVQD